MYPAELVKPMREDLTNVGFEELHTAEAVDTAIAKEGTTLVVVNSVCGCAAANARPVWILLPTRHPDTQLLVVPNCYI